MHPLNRVLHPLALALAFARLATRVFHVTNRGLPNPKKINIKSNVYLVGCWGLVWGEGTHYLLSGKSGLTGVAFVSAQ